LCAVNFLNMFCLISGNMRKLILLFILLLASAVLAEIDIQIEGQKVLIQNIGSDVYTDPVSIKLVSKDKELNIERETNIEPGETITLDLGGEVYTGVYDLYVNDNLFASGLSIDGKQSLSNKIGVQYLYAFFGIVAAILVFLVITRRKRYINFLIRRRNKQKQLEQIYVQADPEKKYVQEFRDRMVETKRPEYKSMPTYTASKPIPGFREMREKYNTQKAGAKFNIKDLKPNEEHLNKFREESSFLKKSRKRFDGTYKKDPDEDRS